MNALISFLCFLIFLVGCTSQNAPISSDIPSVQKSTSGQKILKIQPTVIFSDSDQYTSSMQIHISQKREYPYYFCNENNTNPQFISCGAFRTINTKQNWNISFSGGMLTNSSLYEGEVQNFVDVDLRAYGKLAHTSQFSLTQNTSQSVNSLIRGYATGVEIEDSILQEQGSAFIGEFDTAFLLPEKHRGNQKTAYINIKKSSFNSSILLQSRSYEYKKLPKQIYIDLSKAKNIGLYKITWRGEKKNLNSYVEIGTENQIQKISKQKYSQSPEYNLECLNQGIQELCTFIIENKSQKVIKQIRIYRE